jgi:hypothetical protein
MIVIESWSGPDGGNANENSIGSESASEIDCMIGADADCSFEAEASAEGANSSVIFMSVDGVCGFEAGIGQEAPGFGELLSGPDSAGPWLGFSAIVS